MRNGLLVTGIPIWLAALVLTVWTTIVGDYGLAIVGVLMFGFMSYGLYDLLKNG